MKRVQENKEKTGKRKYEGKQKELNNLKSVPLKVGKRRQGKTGKAGK